MTRTRRRGGKDDVNKATFKERQLVKTSFWSGKPMFEVICRSLDIDLLEKERIKDVAYEWEYEKFKAAADGDLERLKQVHRVYPPWDRIVPEYRDEDDDLRLLCTFAAKGRHLDCLRFAHENGACMDYSTCLGAASGGSVECLKYVLDHVGYLDLESYIGRSIDEDICLWAAHNGQLDCLQYMHEFLGSSLHFDEWRLCEAPMYHGHFECLKYVHENGSPVIWTDCLLLIECLNEGPENVLYDDPMKCLRYVLRYEASVVEWDMSIGVYPWLVDAYVGNLVDDIFRRVIESLEGERAAVVIQRRWLNHIYTPGSRSTAMKCLADDFASRVQ